MYDSALKNDRKIFAIAPMMDWTDRHCRYFHRLLSKNALLYTEMVVADALIHGDVKRHLDYSDVEHPVACQLGGSEPDKLVHAAKLVQQWGYDEVNLNVGCPSDRVQSGTFGACLMRQPELVAQCVNAMKQVVDIPSERFTPDDFAQRLVVQPHLAHGVDPLNHEKQILPAHSSGLMKRPFVAHSASKATE